LAAALAAAFDERGEFPAHLPWQADGKRGSHVRRIITRLPLRQASTFRMEGSAPSLPQLRPGIDGAMPSTDAFGEAAFSVAHPTPLT
jgi:hypothetical protein